MTALTLTPGNQMHWLDAVVNLSAALLGIAVGFFVVSVCVAAWLYVSERRKRNTTRLQTVMNSGRVRTLQGNRKEHLMAEMKILTTDQVRELAEHARAHDFNRQISPEMLKRLDPDKFHIASLMLFGHERSRENDPLHHRLRIFLGLKGRREPLDAWIDVTDEDWAPLPDAEAVRAQFRAGEE